MEFTKNRIRAVLQELERRCVKKRTVVAPIRRCGGDYELKETFEPERYSWEPFSRDQTWGGRDKHYWFWAEADASCGIVGEPLWVKLGTGADDIWNTDNPQILAYQNGKLAAAMDMNHQEMELTGCLREGDRFSLGFYAYSNSAEESNFFHLSAEVPDAAVTKLYYDMKVVYEAAVLLEDDDLDGQEALKILNHCVNLLDLRRVPDGNFYASVQAAGEYLEEAYYGKRKEAAVTVHSTGHTHIDVAWKWPLRQTRQKAVRSFLNVLNLMERYPEYRFMSSQPQLYQFVKEDAPWLFERIREKIREGRWEAEGGMWLEPDCNLSSGESLIRHLLYGTRFFEEELGAEPNEVLWLPDVFGYSAALPQIMRQFGLRYFMTTKLGWNDHNQFPYDTFEWAGIDGSRVLTHMITTKPYDKGRLKKGRAAFNTTYNGLQDAGSIMGTWQRYQNKEASRELLTVYGYGDGGGGPTAGMLEQDRRLRRSVASCPKTRQTKVKEYFHILEENMDRKYLPRWQGELYLEYHRGTYTSVAEGKRNNRKSEFLNQDAEFFSVLAQKALPYPRKRLEKNWKLLLLNQFHDILPGSSIREVYEDSEKQYAEIQWTDREIIRKAQEAVLEEMQAAPGGEGLAVWNTLSFARTSLAEVDREPKAAVLTQRTAEGTWLCRIEQAPPKSVKILPAQKDGGRRLEAPPVFLEITEENGRLKGLRTPYFFVRLAENGEFESLKDLEADREILQKGRTGNRLIVYEDRPLEFDAWNIDPYYEEKSWNFDGLEELKVLENGPVRGCIYLRRKFLESELEQWIYFYGHTRRIDFRNRLNWKEHQLLLKTEFPADVFAQEADYEIQFGNVKRPAHRNTTWDQAKFEVCAHKWADLSEPGYGVALLNDCRYGCDIHDSVLRLTLLKSGIFPDPEADQGVHEFTYGLYPHPGDFRKGRVVQEAYDLNCPLYARAAETEREACRSLFQIGEENIIAETVKAAEDGDGIVLRLYEAYGMRTKVHLALERPFWIEKDTAAEKPAGEKGAGEKTKEAVWEMRPYEICTLRLRG